jgi:hypothetical protein
MPIAILYNAWCRLIMGTDEIRTRPMRRTEIEYFPLSETRDKTSRDVVFKIIRYERKLKELDTFFVKDSNVVCVEEIVAC